MRTSAFLLAAASLFDLSIAGYALEDDYMTDFYGGFEFFGFHIRKHLFTIRFSERRPVCTPETGIEIEPRDLSTGLIVDVCPLLS